MVHYGHMHVQCSPLFEFLPSMCVFFNHFLLNYTALRRKKLCTYHCTSSIMLQNLIKSETQLLFFILLCTYFLDNSAKSV